MTNDVAELLALVNNSASFGNGKLVINDESLFRKKINNWVRISTMEEGPLQGWSRYFIRLAALELGIFPASIHELYMARGRDEVSPAFTVPAINMRVLPFSCAKAALKAAQSINAGALIFEIARSEIGYTAQQPAEFATNILAAAIAVGYQGPVFIQGDHYQVSLKRYQENPQEEIDKIQNLIHQSIQAGFFNIDIDTSTLVDISQDDIHKQQDLNIDLSAFYSDLIRRNEPEGVTISIGGEIGEVGGRNSTVEEIKAYLDGYTHKVAEKYAGITGLSKISIQTGTSHGGVVLPDGSIAEVNVDFETLRDLSRVARYDYGLGGTVQHGASTLPEDAFGKFVEYEAVEVHLATNFMNMFYEKAPVELVHEMYAYLKETYQSERKPSMTDEQFYYKTRKNALGPFKKKIFLTNGTFHDQMEDAWYEKFKNLFSSLEINNTREIIDKYIPKVAIQPKLEDYLGVDVKGEDVSDLAD